MAKALWLNANRATAKVTWRPNDLTRLPLAVIIDVSRAGRLNHRMQ
jgi:hypothetical protein